MTTPEPPDVRPRLLLSWSSGKDAAWCLHTLQQSQEYEIAGLL
ncbi:MAG: Diphthamide synthase, partial [Capsulimonas sp.]|nr:Diphthamide synthase [Capsulimonas sp.]